MSKTINSANQFSLFGEPAPASEPEPTPLREPQPEAPPREPRLVLIAHEENGVVIEQRPDDGYLNATAMCRAFGKSFADYRRLDVTADRLNELASNMGIPILELVQSRVGGNHRGTWVHRRVAQDLAQWLSPKFWVVVNGWIDDWIAGRRPQTVDDDCFEARRLLEHLAEGVDLANQRLAQMGPMLTETWQAQIHTAYRDSLRSDQVAPPSYTGKRQLPGPRRTAPPPPTTSGLPPLAHPRSCKCDECRRRNDD
jgi:hypothetical protein